MTESGLSGHLIRDEVRMTSRMVLGLVLAQPAGICSEAPPPPAAVAPGSADAGCEPPVVVDRDPPMPTLRTLVQVSSPAGEMAAGPIKVIKDGTGGIAFAVRFTG